jgi:protein gp37
MSDLFGIGIPEEWTDNVLYAIKKCPTWRFYLLTKQPQNLPKWSPFPDNCWVGVTACNAKMAEEAGFWLWEVKARVKFISFEPLLERIQPHFADYLSEDVDGIKWVIIGAQTKPYKPPRKEWIDEIVDAADRAKIPVFLKDNLRPALQSVYGKELPMRQEMPL